MSETLGVNLAAACLAVMVVCCALLVWNEARLTRNWQKNNCLPWSEDETP